MAETVEIVRSLHILFAILWGGGSLYHGAIAMGSFFNSNETARRQWWTQGKFGPFLGLSSLLTLIFGLWTFMLVGADSYGGGEGMVLNLGMAAGLIGVVVGWGGHMPTMIKLAKAVEAGDTATVEKLEHREHLLDKISFIVVIITVIAMSTFRLFA